MKIPTLTVRPYFKQPKHILLVFPIALLIFLLAYRLNNWPAIWWDEGWTLDAARNWIVHNHLGHYLDGQPINARIPVRFPVVIPVALSMKIFGIGIWQGRLPSVISTLLSLLIVLRLTDKIYNRRVGIAILVLLCFSPVIFNPLFIGRQVLAEMPMLFYLLGGYAFMWIAITQSPAWSVAAALFFGLALQAKLQVPPFWLVSMILAIWVSIKYKLTKTAYLILGISLGGITSFIILTIIQNIYMPGSFSDPGLIKILINSVIVVLAIPARETAINIVALYAIPQLLGLIWAGKQVFITLFVKKSDHKTQIDEIDIKKIILRTALWGLGASWFLWYMALALFWTRYLFPPYFISCIFVAAYWSELTNNFNIRLSVRRASDIILGREMNWTNIQVLLFLFCISYTIGVTILSAKINLSSSTSNPISVVEYLDNNIPSGARVETFESELFFLAPGVDFHYPSDSVSMQLVRKLCIDLQLKIGYDPLQTNPSYLISGPYDRHWELYTDILTQGKYKLEADIGGYQIYRIKTDGN